MYKFLVIIEKVEDNFSVYSPDLPGCVATAATKEEAEQNMYDAIEMHVRGLEVDKQEVPKPRAIAEYVVVK